MAALEDRVLTMIMQEGSLAEPLRRNLVEEHFLNPESRSIYRFLKQHWFNPRTAGSLPSLERVQARWPAFQLTAVEHNEQLRARIDELKWKAFQSDVWGLADYFKELVEEDPENAMSVLKARAQEIEFRYHNEEVGAGMGLQEILSMAKEHYDGALSGSIYGIPWPWPCLTEDTLGKRAGDFVVFYGRMKSMKTWILLFCAAMDYLDHNKRVLIWSKEMSPLKLGLRMASLLSRVDYQLFKKGLLPPRIRDHCFRVLNSLVTGNVRHDLKEGAEVGTRDLLLLAGKDAPRELEGLKQKVQEFQPDVIYLDSFYHMDSERSAKTNPSQRWQRVAALAEDIKAYAEDVGLPIIAVHQANRYGEKTYGNTLADLADADVIAREADLIIRVLKGPTFRELHEEEYEVEFERLLRNQKIVHPKGRRLPRIKLGRKDAHLMNEQLMERIAEQSKVPRVGGELALVLGGNREGVLEAFTIKAVPSYNFSIITDRPDMKFLKEWMKLDEKAEEDGAAVVKTKKAKPKTSAADFSQALAESGMK